MVTTFSEVARRIAGGYLSPSSLKSALEPLGARAEHPLLDLDTERKLQLTSQFVRGLRVLGVADAHRLEHELYESLGVAPTSRRAVVIKDAISLIAVRNHVSQLAVAMGMSWSASMAVQSAVSDVARFVSTNGGGRVETEAPGDGRIHFEVWTNRPLPPFTFGGLTTPPWLVGVIKLAEGFRSRPEASGTHLDFWIAAPAEALVA